MKYLENENGKYKRHSPIELCKLDCHMASDLLWFSYFSRTLLIFSNIWIGGGFDPGASFIVDSNAVQYAMKPFLFYCRMKTGTQFINWMM